MNRKLIILAAAALLSLCSAAQARFVQSGPIGYLDSVYRHLFPMTDAAITNGIYMKTLSKKEALAVMADIVLAGESDHRRYDEMLAVADVLHLYYPNNLTVLLAPAIASDGMAKQEFISKYPRESDIPPELLGRLDFLGGGHQPRSTTPTLWDGGTPETRPRSRSNAPPPALPGEPAKLPQP